MHTHDFYEIFLVVDGSAFHHVNGFRQLLSNGSMVLVRPDDAHSYEKNGDEDCQFINLAFPPETFHSLFAYLDDSSFLERLLGEAASPLVTLPEKEYVPVREKLEGLALLPADSGQRTRTLLRMLLADLMCQYFMDFSSEKSNIPSWLEDLVHEMQKKENFREGLPKLQTLSNKSQEYISRIFKACLAKTPTDFVNETRLNYTVNMLIHSNLDILEIALDAGFNNLSHYYHLFKSRYRTSPRKYRKLHQQLQRF